MKIKINKLKSITRLIPVVAFFILTLVFTGSAFAQPPPPPGGGGTTSNNGGNQTGGNAPIGGGSLILLGMAAAYGGKKVYDIKKNMNELEE